jgi:hypothetical protein
VASESVAGVDKGIYDLSQKLSDANKSGASLDQATLDKMFASVAESLNRAVASAVDLSGAKMVLLSDPRNENAIPPLEAAEKQREREMQAEAIGDAVSGPLLRLKEDWKNATTDDERKQVVTTLEQIRRYEASKVKTLVNDERRGLDEEAKSMVVQVEFLAASAAQQGHVTLDPKEMDRFRERRNPKGMGRFGYASAGAARRAP